MERDKIIDIFYEMNVYKLFNLIVLLIFFIFFVLV